MHLMKPFKLLLCLCACIPLHVVAQQLKPQRGNASYYADYFHGRTMSNGEKYHRDSMTCAHLKYPLGTWLRVRNLTNGKEVVVQVTDRGPYSRKFSIDLSRAAARQLDIIQYGWRPVEITPFVPGKVPFVYEPPREKPVLNLGFSTDGGQHLPGTPPAVENHGGHTPRHAQGYRPRGHDNYRTGEKDQAITHFLYL